jgi:orotidine-5'-phosphate decarboxylase
VKPRERIFVALDTPDLERARRLVRLLQGQIGGFKVGLQLFTLGGPEIVKEIRRSGAELFLDLKLHDIPNTVAGAAAAVTRLGATYFTVHACGGAEMIRRGVDASAEAAEQIGLPLPTLLAVTVLTSHDDNDLETIGIQGPCRTAVLRLARLARASGAGGLVCSPLEVEAVRDVFPGGTLVVPGIRPAGTAAPRNDDQSRTATPGRAVAAGADLLVIGRPITRAEDPADAAQAIAAEIEREGH